MTDFQKGDKVTHKYGDDTYDVLGVDGDAAWCKKIGEDGVGAHRVFPIELLTKIPQRFAKGHSYRGKITGAEYFVVDTSGKQVIGWSRRDKGDVWAWSDRQSNIGDYIWFEHQCYCAKYHTEGYQFHWQIHTVSECSM